MRLPDIIRPLLLVAIFLGFLAVKVAATTHYVDINSTNPTPPYTDWSIAATNIQNAINSASAGDLVLVTNGAYSETSTNLVDRTLKVAVPARIVVPSGVTVSSVNGPSVTLILGASICCAGLESNATLNGFTLTNGSTMGLSSGLMGAGVHCVTTNAIISNCVICSNSALAGAGVYLGTLTNCIISNNVATYYQDPSGTRYSGGGAYGSRLNNCTVIGNFALQGGGAFDCILNNCSLIRNTASNLGPAGGGAYGGVLNNCLVFSNAAPYGSGGAAFSNEMNNCLIIYNQAGGDGVSVATQSAITNCTICYNRIPADSDFDNVVFHCTLRNCILYYDDSLPPLNFFTYGSTDIQNCCMSPEHLAEGEYYNYGNNITNPPLFVNITNDFHLQSNSPCINAGNNFYIAAPNDFDGNPRIVGGTVDIGAYEYQTPTSVISYAYLQQYGLPTDGSVDSADLDGTPFDVYQDWIAGLNPTNPAAVLMMLFPTTTSNASGVTVSWESVSGINYNILRVTNLTTAFTTIQSNIVGQAGTTSYMDATATNGGPYFYQVTVP